MLRAIPGNGTKIASRTIVVIASMLIWQSVMLGQSEIDLRWANDVIEAANRGSRADKLAAVTTVLKRFRAQRGLGINEREFIQFLEFQKSYLAIDPNGLSTRLNEATSATTPEARKAALNAGRMELLQRYVAASHTLTPNTITAEDAKTLVTALNAASQSLDDIRSLSLVGGSSALTDLFSRASGILNFVGSVNDPQARDIVGSLSSTIGSMSSKLRRLDVTVPGPMKAFDYALAVSAAQLQVTRDGYIKTTAALDDVAKAIGGDAEALSRLPEHATQVNDSLSTQKFGAAMGNAIADRIAESIPLVRSLTSWIKPVSRVPGINRFLRLQLNPTLYGRFEIVQSGEAIKAIATDGHPGYYGKGETLFEGRFKENNVYSITIYQIWVPQEKKIHSGMLVVQGAGFIRMQSPTLDNGLGVYLYP